MADLSQVKDRLGLARPAQPRPFAFIGERAKRARHYQGCTNSSWCGTYIYIYIINIPPFRVEINIASKVGIFPEAESRGKYSLPRVQYYRYSTRKG